MKEKTLGFGIVGVGMVANCHAQAIQLAAQTHNLRLMGVTSRTEVANIAFADRYGVPFHTTSLTDLLARDDIQVICITTPSGAHLEPALAAINAGKHVIVEKPMDVSLERADAMIAAAKTAGVHLGAVFQARFSAGAIALKQAIQSGRFGRLALCSAYVKWHRTAAYYTGWKGSLALDGGGAVINQAIHALDLLTWLAGVPTDVFARITRRVHQNIEAEDTATANFRFGDGALGTLEATTAAYPGWERRIDICGEFGSAAIEDDRIVRWDFVDMTPEDYALRDRLQQGTSRSGAGAPQHIDVSGHQHHIEEMANAIRHGSALSIQPWEARQTLAVVRAIYDSAAGNLPVSLAPLP